MNSISEHSTSDLELFKLLYAGFYCIWCFLNNVMQVKFFMWLDSICCSFNNKQKLHVLPGSVTYP